MKKIRTKSKNKKEEMRRKPLKFTALRKTITKENFFIQNRYNIYIYFDDD